MRNPDSLRERYLRDGLPVRLGGLAADLSRIASFSDTPAHQEAVTNLIREAAYFTEWCAPEATLEVQVALAQVQLVLALWRRGLSRWFADDLWRATLAVQAQAWSDRILALSGLLPAEPVERQEAQPASSSARGC